MEPHPRRGRVDNRRHQHRCNRSQRETVSERMTERTIQAFMPLAAIIASAWVVLGTAAIKWPGTESAEFLANRAKLERMNPEQRRKLWGKYQEFLKLPPAEQDRLRRLQADLKNQTPDKRQRYVGLMDRYKKWKDARPLYQRQMLEDAATQGPGALYSTIRDVEQRQELEDAQRLYWYLPDNPAMRAMVRKTLAKLSPEEIEQLDQTSPLDRTQALFSRAHELGIEAPAMSGPGRPWLRGPLPPPDPDKFQEFMKKLPRNQLEELSDLGGRKPFRERRAVELYYLTHPEELRERLRRGEAGLVPSNMPDRPRGPERKEPDPNSPPPARREPAKPRGVGIPSRDP
jgi:hypothetical protein